MKNNKFYHIDLVFLMSKPLTSLPPLEWVRVFEAAARSGNFTAAATETGLTQAAISQRIRNLESHLGVRLFNRLPRGVSLTVEGEAWLPYVRNALNILANSTDELFAKPRRSIRILASTSLISLWFAPRLQALPQTYQISFHTHHMQTDFAREDTDVQVRFGAGPWPEMQSAHLLQETLTPMASPVLLAQSPDDWTRLPHIALAGPRPGWLAWGAQVIGAPPPVPMLRFDSFGQSLAAAQNSAGVILGSLALCRAALNAGSLVRLSDETLPTNAGYWLTAASRVVPPPQWHDLVTRFADKSSIAL